MGQILKWLFIASSFSGFIMETKVATADNYANATSISSSSGKNLHWQVRYLFYIRI